MTLLVFVAGFTGGLEIEFGDGAVGSSERSQVVAGTIHGEHFQVLHPGLDRINGARVSGGVVGRCGEAPLSSRTGAQQTEK